MTEYGSDTHLDPSKIVEDDSDEELTPYERQTAPVLSPERLAEIRARTAEQAQGVLGVGATEAFAEVTDIKDLRFKNHSLTREEQELEKAKSRAAIDEARRQLDSARANVLAERERENRNTYPARLRAFHKQTG